MDEDINLSPVEMVVLSMTVFVVFSLVLQESITINPEMGRLLSWMDNVCCVVFLSEWIYRFVHAEKKRSFVLRNFIDLIASIPFGWLPGLKALRLMRLVQVIRIAGSVNRFATYCRHNSIQTARFAFFILFTLLMMTGPVLILFFEYDSGSINTAENALWWTYCTVTTIGYGDLYPVTTGGRIFTVFVSLGGIGMFGILSTLLINYVIHINHEKNSNQTERELPKEDREHGL